MSPLEEFIQCIDDISYCRAGWDNELSPEQRRKEDDLARQAKDRAKELWATFPIFRPDMKSALNGSLVTLGDLT